MRQQQNTNPHGQRIVVKQTVPRSGMWLHTFKVSKETNAETNGPELLNEGLSSVDGLKNKLKMAVGNVLLSPGSVQARRPINGRWVGI